MKKINFNAGPSVLPEIVKQQLAEAIVELKNEGVSIAEISHRSPLFISILEELTQLVKENLQIGDEHEIVFTQGGARLLFAQIPMNFLQKNETVGFIDSGYWAIKAMEYAQYYGQTKIIASSKNEQYYQLPIIANNNYTNLKYIQLCSNNTIYGTQFKQLPTFNCPLVVDMSSDIFSIERDFRNIDIAFACAQKNIGLVGVSLVIIKKDFLEKQLKNIPPIFSFQNLVEKKSNYNTPPIVGIYSALLMMRWLKNEGGIQQKQAQNIQKSNLLYNEIERNSLFECNVKKENRSMMNICFTAKNKETELSFLNFCNTKNIIGIKGHKVAGGFRASLYNAQTLSSVEYLINTMQEFEQLQTIHITL